MRKEMNEYSPVACVTGASGMIGGSIVRKLLLKNYRVRVLTRDNAFNIPKTELFIGGLDNERVLSSFLAGAELLFHCAAELRDESKMWEVNVSGTELLLKLARRSEIKYFCFISSVGVAGLTENLLVDEQTSCNPQNTYERSKLAAENIVYGWAGDRGVVILRPTNVVNDQKPGVLSLAIRNTFRDRLEVFVKGGENAHIVHADDVADAAIYFIDSKFNKPECFIVSCDHDNNNTYAGLWKLYNKYSQKKYINHCTVLHAPVIIPHILRNLKRGRSNKETIKYSSQKLLSQGFKFSLGVDGAVQQIVSQREKNLENSTKTVS